MVGTALLIVLLLAIDRITKIFMEIWLQGRGMVEIIPGIIGFELVEGGNTGAAFGLFSGSPYVLAVLTSVLLLALLYLLFPRKLHSKLLHVALALVVAGGLGNLYDRIVYGAVTDFIEFLFVRFAVFNFADCCVSVGAALAVCYLLFSKKDEPLLISKAATNDVVPSKPEELPDEK